MRRCLIAPLPRTSPLTMTRTFQKLTTGMSIRFLSILSFLFRGVRLLVSLKRLSSPASTWSPIAGRMTSRTGACSTRNLALYREFTTSLATPTASGMLPMWLSGSLSRCSFIEIVISWTTSIMRHLVPYPDLDLFQYRHQSQLPRFTDLILWQPLLWL